MRGIDKVKLMDSGTAMVHAASEADAAAKVREILLREGNSVEEKDGEQVMNASSLFFWQFVTARIETTAEDGLYAVSFREGNAGRIFPFAPPCRRAVKRMNRIRTSLAR